MDFEQLSSVLTEFGEVKKQNKVIKVLVDEDATERRLILEQISDKLSTEIDDTEPRTSALGLIRYDGYKIVVKPKDAQEDGSNGVDNEVAFVDIVKSKLGSEPINLMFRGSNGIVFYANNVVDVERISDQYINGEKADIELHAANNFVYKLSLKKDSAKMWESADTLYADKAKLAIEKALEGNVVNLTIYHTADGKIKRAADGNLVVRMSKEIYLEATPEEKQAAVFGNDIKDNGAVIKKTFSEKDFIQEQGNSTIIVDCSKVYYDIEHLEDTEDDVVFYIRNDCTRNNKRLGLAGIRIIAAYRSRVVKKSEKIHLDINKAWPKIKRTPTLLPFLEK